MIPTDTTAVRNSASDLGTGSICWRQPGFSGPSTSAGVSSKGRSNQWLVRQSKLTDRLDFLTLAIFAEGLDALNGSSAFSLPATNRRSKVSEEATCAESRE